MKNAEKLISQLKDIVRTEVEKDANLLDKNRSKSSILIGGAVDRCGGDLAEADSCRAGVVENVKRERNTIFEEQQVRDRVKEMVFALVLELNQTETKADDKNN